MPIFHLARRVRLACLAALLLATAPASAEVKEQGPSSFVLGFSQTLSAPPARVWSALADIARWWSSDHTYSGSAANLSLRAEAGACFCERWAGGSVEHGRVIAALPHKLLRLDSALGPLQERAVTGVLTFSLQPEGAGTKLGVVYRVGGGSALLALAPLVDRVIGEQVARLARLVDTGKADSPSVPPAKP